MIKRRLFTLVFYIILFSAIIIVHKSKIRIPYFPLSIHKVNKIELDCSNKRIATEDEKKKILTLLNSNKYYDEILSKSIHWPSQYSQIRIFLKNGTILYIRKAGEYSIMINHQYIVNQPEICKMIEEL